MLFNQEKIIIHIVQICVGRHIFCLITFKEEKTLGEQITVLAAIVISGTNLSCGCCTTLNRTIKENKW